jgi:hypothetical protein
VLGHAAGRVTAQVTVISPGDTEGDVTAPALTLVPRGSAGNGGWFRSAVTVRAAAVDDRGGRLTIRTTVDGASSAVPAVRSVDTVVTGDGRHTVTAMATDRAGNDSAVSQIGVDIDTTAPTVSGTVSDRRVTVTGADATSGPERLEYAIGGGPWTVYDGPVGAPDPGRHTVSFRAVDRAGNTSAAQQAVLPADLSGPLTGNVGPIAVPTASYTAGWNSVGALNDGADPASPGQAQIWGTWSGTRPAGQWIQYDWTRAIRLTGASIRFWRDSAQGTGDGVAEPDSWELEYWDGAAWHPVTGASGYGTSSTAVNTVTFDPVVTSRLRAVIAADGNGSTYSAVAVTEWRVIADERATVPVTVTAQPRCLSGKVYLAVTARNGHTAPVDVELVSAYGSKVFVAVAPGAGVYQSFAARAASVPAGTATATAAATVAAASYVALSC